MEKDKRLIAILKKQKHEDIGIKNVCDLGAFIEND